MQQQQQQQYGKGGLQGSPRESPRQLLQVVLAQELQFALVVCGTHSRLVALCCLLVPELHSVRERQRGDRHAPWANADTPKHTRPTRVHTHTPAHASTERADPAAGRLQQQAEARSGKASRAGSAARHCGSACCSRRRRRAGLAGGAEEAPPPSNTHLILLGGLSRSHGLDGRRGRCRKPQHRALAVFGRPRRAEKTFARNATGRILTGGATMRV
jgi:hypothetical protein